MNYKITKLIQEYTSKIALIEQSNLNDFSIVENGIKISRKFLQDLRVLVRDNDFKTKQDEITFFKEQKPFIYARLKFYAKLYDFLLTKPEGSIQQQRNYIDNEIQRLQRHNKRNLDFIKYYREKATYLDKVYFVRGKDNISLASDTSHFYTDAEFSTSHDNMMAKIMAYDLLINHYQQELKNLRDIEKGVKKSKNSILYSGGKCLKWTASKTDLIELIYALQTSGAIEDGMEPMKVMASACEKIFNTKLGNFYRTYLEIKARKNDRTKFLDKMKITLINKMNTEEN